MERKIIDSHTHIGYWPTLHKTKRDLLKSMRRENVNCAIVSVDASEFENEDPNSGILDNPLIKMSQIKIAEIGVNFCKKHPKKLYSLIRIKPYFEKNIKELQRFYDENKEYIKGIKIHPALSHIKMTNKKIIPYIEFAKNNSLPVLVHTAADEYSDIAHLEKVAKKYRDVIFIAAHLQLCSDNKKAIDILSKNENIYGDTARVSPETILLCKKKGILDKIMFGSDCPIDGLNTYPNQYYQALFRNNIKLTKKERSLLMCETAQKIYKI